MRALTKDAFGGRLHQVRPPGRIVASLLVAFAGAVALTAPNPAQAAFPGSNGKIAFVPHGGGGIFVTRQDGSGSTQLTYGTPDYNPMWSPDGTKIAFTRPTEPLANAVWVMNADGTGQTQLTDSYGSNPAWSPDGTKIAFEGINPANENDEDIYIMNADGTNPTDLTNDPSGAQHYPTWSPNGTTIAYVNNSSGTIDKINVNGTGNTQLTTGSSPDWSPDGTKIVFAGVRATTNGIHQIYTVNGDGTGETQLTNTSGQNITPAWSPDGTKILFVPNSLFDTPIYMMNADGTGQTSLSIPSSTFDSSSWQPLVTGHHPPLASFTVSDPPPVTNQSVTLTSTSTGGDGTITGQAWDLDNDGSFDDGTATTASPSFTTPGAHIVRLSVVNSQGARDALAATINVLSPPDTTIVSGPTGTTNDDTPTFSFSGTGTSFECRLDGGAYARCASPITTAPLADGAHVLEVRAKDAYGHVDPAPASRPFTVDALPDTGITGGPSGTTASTSASFAFASTQPSTFQCRLDGGAWVACMSPWSYAGLPNGSHSFEVKATDMTGHTDPTPATAFWLVDTSRGTDTASPTTGATGKRAAASKKCKKFPKGPKRQKCIKKAKNLPV